MHTGGAAREIMEETLRAHGISCKRNTARLSTGLTIASPRPKNEMTDRGPWREKAIKFPHRRPRSQSRLKGRAYIRYEAYLQS